MTATTLRFHHLLRSELIKLTSLRSMMLSLAAILVGGLAISLLLAFTMESAGIPDEPSVRFAVTTITLGSIMLGQLIAAVVGVLAISSEYSAGTIQVSLTAVPMRLPVLAAKAVVLFWAVVLTGLLTTFGSWAATYPLFDALGLAVSLDAPGFALALLGGSLYLGVTALFALGVGAIVRSAAGGVAVVLGVLLIVPIGISVVSGSIEWLVDVRPYLLSNAGESMSQIASSSTDAGRGAALSPIAATAVAFAWSAATLVVGAIMLRKRDV